MSWIVYEVGPIDHGWEHLRTVNETLSYISLLRYDAEAEGPKDINTGEVNRFISSWDNAKAAAAKEGWEGDFRHEPRVFWLPSDTCFEYGFVFKQENNGTTFVVSPQELPSMLLDSY